LNSKKKGHMVEDRRSGWGHRRGNFQKGALYIFRVWTALISRLSQNQAFQTTTVVNLLVTTSHFRDKKKNKQKQPEYFHTFKQCAYKRHWIGQ
jgi:hypothetical protein